MPLRDLDDLLLVQCRPDEALRLADLAADESTGLVVTGDAATATAHRLAAAGFPGPVLCDRDAYTGEHRKQAADGCSRDWTARQHDAGLVALTDSGYLAPGDWAGLDRILQDAHDQPAPTVAVLPASTWWLRSPDTVAALAARLVDAALPVALVLEHVHDPFGARYVVGGLLALLHRLRTTGVRVLLLRSDVSAVGACAHGAHAAAVGTGASLRHFSPVRGAAVPPPGEALSAFVPSLLGHHKLETIDVLVDRATDVSQLWECGCAECHGRELDWIAHIHAPGEAMLRHSLRALLGMHADHVRARTGRAYGPEQRAARWHQVCSHALGLHQQVAGLLRGWRVPDPVRNWYRLAGEPPALPEPPEPPVARSQDEVGRASSAAYEPWPTGERSPRPNAP